MASVLVSAPAQAVPGGRIELRDQAIRTIDTRLGRGVATREKVTSVTIGSGVLRLGVLSPDDVGTAVVHACSDPAPTDRFDVRLDPNETIRYTRVFAAEESCLTSSEPVHVIVDDTGTVTDAPAGGAEQYVALASPLEVSTDTVVGSETTLVIARPAQLTADATAAIVGLEVLTAPGPGFASAYGCDGPRPVLADVAFSRTVAANVAVVPIEPGEDICVFVRAGATIRTSLIGELRADGPTPEALPPRWQFVPGQVRAAGLRPINPVRVIDTRGSGAGAGVSSRALAADSVLQLSFGDLVGPSTTAVSMNVTAVNAAAAGFLTVWPCDGERPEASNLNFAGPGAVPNLVVTALSASGTACISTSQDANVIVDVNGTYEAGGGLNAVAVEPTRVLDTRQPIGTSIRGRVAAGNEVELQITGRLLPDAAAPGTRVPGSAGAATLNVTAVGSGADGFVTVYPCGSQRPTASNLNFLAGEAVPNLVTTALSPTGSICLYASQTVHLVADLASWYGLGQAGGFVGLSPTRVLDTRNAVGVATAGRTTASQVIELDFARSPDVADLADAVVMNVTAAQAAGGGFVTVWPCDQDQPTVSNLNVRPGRTRANLTTVKLSAEGTVCLASTTPTQLIADVTGYLTDFTVRGDALVLNG